MLRIMPLFSLALIGGCSSLSLTALHDPLYRATPHASTITASATDAKSGVTEIRIDATVGDIAACSNGGSGFLPSLIPCRTGASAQARVCTFANVKTPVSCALMLQLGDRRLVTYTTSAKAGSTTATTPAITYAAGAPLTEARVNLLITTITMPWETARPVWWHTDSPNAGTSPADKIDVGFYPDADWGQNYQGFTDGMATIARGAFFTSTESYSATYRLYQDNFNLWAGPAGADGQDCTRTFAGAAATVAAATDGDTIIHSATFRDCASMSIDGGGQGTTQSTISDAAWVFTHESGHFLHGLGDEYVGGFNGAISTPMNVYGSKALCQGAAGGTLMVASQCAQIGSTGTWRFDDGRPTTMEDRQLDSDWRTASALGVANRMNKCGAGSCF